MEFRILGPLEVVDQERSLLLGGNDDTPNWSPDGRVIVFESG